MNKFEELIKEFKGLECTFLKMESAFANATDDEVLNNISVNRLLENKSVSFKYEDEEWLNVEFEILEENTDEPLETIIRVTNIEAI